MNPKRLLLGSVSVLVSAGLLVWLLARVDLRQMAELVQGASWPWLLTALLLTCALPFTSVYRWLGVLQGARYAAALFLRPPRGHDGQRAQQLFALQIR